ncbi:MAG: SDR family oxidoreductase [Candidatus Rokubacteria bacterium]|nr:SDR family oxidoreductase [Candidatus Rokubacteria bacterium]
MGGRFEGRVALITGASRGAGRAIALRLASEGADLVVTYKKEQGLAEEVVEAATGLGRRAVAVPADLELSGDVAQMFEVARARFARLDIFVANAAATAFRPLLEVKDYNVTRTFAITVTAFVLAAQRAAALMGDGFGRIVAVSGIDSVGVMPGHGVLGAAKAAMEMLVRYLAWELGPRGITVNGVCPGLIETDSYRMYVHQGLGVDPAEAQARLIALTPRRRLGSPEDVASLVAFLCSPEGDFLTGQTVILDGGFSLLSPLGTVGG